MATEASTGERRTASAIATHASALLLSGLLLASAGQPLFAEDAWWHLALGRAYAESGPWLSADPLLHTAEGPPAPAAWGFDLGLHALVSAGGFHALRGLHVAWVGAILALGWSMLRRVSGSARFASFGICVFVVLAAYRAFQLRPHLATLLGTLCVLALLVVPRAPPRLGRIAAAGAVFALWANLHGGFLVGLALVGAAALGSLAGAAIGLGEARAERRRAARLGLALLVGFVATCLNPAGIDQHLLFFRAGAATPELLVVADEWSRLDLLAAPRRLVPPTPATWLVAWGILAGLLGASLAAWRQRRSAPGEHRIDPALLASALAACLAMGSAVRLVWLGIVPLLAIGSALPRAGLRRTGAAALAVASLLLVPGFVLAGAWPLVSAGVHRLNYGLPYAVSKFDAHAVWLLRDAGLEGRLFNDYASGGFLGYWLAPRLRAFVNGTLNVPPTVMEALHEVEQRADPEALTPLLDRHGVDVFVGSGLPLASLPDRPVRATARLLEGVPGWTPIFRSVRSALYLRDGERNRANLERIAQHYARERVPFDPARGFDVERVIQAAPDWAIAHGVLPVDFAAVREASLSLLPQERVLGRERLAETFALLGLYERALAVDRRQLREHPDALPSLRRTVFCWLQLGRAAEAALAAEALAQAAPEEDGLSRLLVEAARAAAEAPGARPAQAARLPLLPPAAGQRVLAAYLAGEIRPRR